jgi:hypothetical protein
MFASSAPARDVVEAPPPARSIDALEQDVLAAHALVACAQRELCRAIAAHAASGAHRLDGARDETEWLANRLALEPATARRLVALAEGLAKLPALAGVLASGEVSLDQAAAVCAFATPESDAELAELARGLTPAQIERLGDELFPPQPADDAELARSRRLDLRWTERRRVLRISGRLPVEQGLIVEGALRRLAGEHVASPLEDAGDVASDPATYAARCADALVDLCQTSAVDAKLPPERASVILHLPPDGGAPHLEHSGVVSGAVAERLACDARFQAIVVDAGGVAHASRLARTAPEPLVRALRERQPTCCFPGCRATRHLHAHHKEPWFLKGETTVDGLVFLCGRHHRFVHEHGWRVTGRHGDLVFHRPDGTILRTGPP